MVAIGRDGGNSPPMSEDTISSPFLVLPLAVHTSVDTGRWRFLPQLLVPAFEAPFQARVMMGR